MDAAGLGDDPDAEHDQADPGAPVALDPLEDPELEQHDDRRVREQRQPMVEMVECLAERGDAQRLAACIVERAGSL